MNKITLNKTKLDLGKKTVKDLQVKTNVSAGRAAVQAMAGATSCCCCQCC